MGTSWLGMGTSWLIYGYELTKMGTIWLGYELTWVRVDQEAYTQSKFRKRVSIQLVIRPCANMWSVNRWNARSNLLYNLKSTLIYTNFDIYSRVGNVLFVDYMIFYNDLLSFSQYLSHTVLFTIVMNEHKSV